MSKNSAVNYIYQDHESRITRLEVVIENINTTLVDMKQSIGTLEHNMKQSIGSLEQDMKQSMRTLDQDMKQGFKDINNRMWTNFFWMIGGFAGLLGLLAHAVHWI